VRLKGRIRDFDGKGEPMSKTMKAAVVEKFSHPLTIPELPILVIAHEAWNA
jgi:hypothetical protein